MNFYKKDRAYLVEQKVSFSAYPGAAGAAVLFNSPRLHIILISHRVQWWSNHIINGNTDISMCYGIITKKDFCIT